MPKKLELMLSIEVYADSRELPLEDANLLRQAQQACDVAYAPYSNFLVGAAILLENGKIIIGTNQENAAYPSGLCAERTAIFAASTQYPNETVKTIAVTARPRHQKEFVGGAPCGSCRQVLSEYENKQTEPIRLIMQREDGSIYIIPSIDTLLPFKFSAENLK